MKRAKIAVIAASILAMTSPLAAHDVTAGDLTIDHPWVWIMPTTAKVGAGYMTIINNGDKADQLVGLSSPNAERVEIHQMSMDNGIMRMRPLDGGLEIPAGGRVSLKPGGFHLMFKKVTTPFVDGEMVPVTLNFMHAGAVQVEFYPSKKGEMSGGNMDHNHEGQTQ